MIRIFTLVILFLAGNALVAKVKSQANPSVAILPLNVGGIVTLGATQDIRITVTNTLSGNIIAYKLRPVITIPAIATILPNAEQTGLPAGWSIVSNVAGSGQIRICNGTDVIGGLQSREIIIKVKGTSIGGPTQCSANLFYGGASCTVSGPAPNGNLLNDESATSSITVVAGCNLSVSALAGTIECNEGTTTITAVTTNAPLAIEYSITGSAPFQTTNVFDNVKAGTFIVTARDIANPTTCVAVSATIIINNPAPIPVPVINIIQPNCNVPTGIINIISETTNLTFSIDGSSTYNSYNGGVTLASGVHTLRAKNGNNCFSQIISFTINEQPSTPATPLVDTIIQPNCTIPTGSVFLSGLPAGNWIINPGTIAGSGPSTTLNSLSATSYNFTVTNNSGCTSVPAINVVVNAEAGSPIAPIIIAIQPSCTIATGSINITSPTANLTFSLDGGAFQNYPVSGFTELNAGNHRLVAKNLNGCLSPFTNFIIRAQPTAPIAPTINILQPSCTSSTGIITITSPTLNNTFSFNNGPFETYPIGGYTAVPGTYSISAQNSDGCDAAITNNIIINPQPLFPAANLSATAIACSGGNSILTVLATGAVSPYEYSLNNGVYQTSNTFNVVAGNYTVTVKDANGCTGVSSNLNIVQPTPISGTIDATSINCNGGNSTLTVFATGGTGPFEYNLNNGVYQSNNTFTVIAGTYLAKVRSIMNPSCSATTASFTIYQPAILIANSSAPAIFYCGGRTVVKVTATGGISPYSGTGNFDKGPGKWSFVVSDAKGCTSSTDVIISPPGCLELKLSPNPAKNSITVNHSAALPMSAIQIFSLNGALVLSNAVPEKAFITTIDISKLANDIYLLVFINGQEKREVKFIKSNN